MTDTREKTYDELTAPWGSFPLAEVYRGYEIFVHPDGDHYGTRHMRLSNEVACFTNIESARKAIDSWILAKEQGRI